MTKYTYLTNKELTSLLLARNDLTEFEYELLDRLIRACDAMEDLERRNGHDS